MLFGGSERHRKNDLCEEVNETLKIGFVGRLKVEENIYLYVRKNSTENSDKERARTSFWLTKSILLTEIVQVETNNQQLAALKQMSE